VRSGGRTRIDDSDLRIGGVLTTVRVTRNGAEIVQTADLNAAA
jgi:hypothetical protein